MPRTTALALTGALLLGAPMAWAAGTERDPGPTIPTAVDAPVGAGSAAADLIAAASEPSAVDAPGPARGAAPGPVNGTAGAPGAAVGGGGSVGPAARRWTWPLAPRPRVVRAFDNPAQPWLPGHRGVDLAGVPGVEVRAPADGIVAFAGLVAGRPVLSIDHAGGLRSTYEPVTSTLGEGDAVTRGQTVGRLAAGHECPALGCLHWGARRGATYLDPTRLIGAGPPILLPLR